MECEVCGGTNFTKESGFYFCSECQTQSQEIQEHAFQEETSQAQINKSAKKIKDAKPTKSDHVTSWECYNVILLSLTEELIQLGADSKIKKIVKCLWIKYLERLEVINLKEDQRPKLPLVHIKRDVNITFGVKKRKRKRKVSSDSSLSESTSRGERSKKKTALAKSQYSEISSKIEDSSSLHNETLTSLRSASEKSDASEKLQFNRFSIRELRKNMPRKHLENHKTDLATSLPCHKFTYSSCSAKYRYGVYFISPVKIYAILYIALLIVKDAIQLGDIFRFLREGHLNFDSYTSLFPDSYSSKTLNIQNHIKKRMFSNKKFRITVANLVEFLGVTDCITTPNLVKMAQRFCEELNLPDAILEAVKNILSRNPMKFGKRGKQSIIPNYEARVMSLIIFVLKLLYGLDGITEKELSNYAQILNMKFHSLNMFNIQKWMEFITYRSLVVSMNHYPTYHLKNTDMNADLFLQYKISHNVLADERSRLVSDMVGYKNLLMKIKNLQHDYMTHIEYPGSLKPFSNYSETIASLSQDQIVYNTLQQSFRKDSLDYLLNPLKYLLKINQDITFKHGGANDNWKLEKFQTNNEFKSAFRLECMYVSAEIIQDSSIQNEEKVATNESTDVNNIQKDFENTHELGFKQNADFLVQLECNDEQKILLDPEESSVSNNFSYDIHYNPYERYWLYLRGGIKLETMENINEQFDKYCDSFKIILSECSRIIDQTNQDLLTEFQDTEVYLIYWGKYKNCKKRKKSIKLKHHIGLVKKSW